MAPLKGVIVAIASVALLIEGVVILTMGDFSPARPTRSAGTEIRSETSVRSGDRDPSEADPLGVSRVANLGAAEPSGHDPIPSTDARSAEAASIPPIGSEPDRVSELDKRAASETIGTSGGEQTPRQPPSEVLASGDLPDVRGQGNAMDIERPPLTLPPEAMRPEVSAPAASPEAERQFEDRQHSARESVAQQATADYYLGADSEPDRSLGASQKALADASETSDNPPRVSPIDGNTQTTNSLISDQAFAATGAAKLFEDRLHAERERLAERNIAADAATAEQARLAQIEADRQASIALAQKQAQAKERLASIARIEAGVENRLQSARERLATQKTAADAAATEQARLAQIEADRQASIALAKKQAQEDERLASIARIEARVENRLHSARGKLAMQKTAADAAATEQARLAQIEADRQASIALAKKQAQEKERLASIARIEVGVENRLQSARERLATQKTAADAAATEQARLAQIEADRQASIALAKKQAQEEERLASIARIEASVENRLQSAREKLATQKTAADAAATEQARIAQIEANRQASFALAKKQAQEEERLASIARIEAGVENRLHGARERLAEQKTATDAAAERIRLAQIGTDRQASIAVAQKQTLEKERLASIATTEETVESRLHAARKAAVRQTIADVGIGSRAEAARVAADSQNAVKSSADVAMIQSVDAPLSSSPVSRPIFTGSINRSSIDTGVQRTAPLGRREAADTIRRAASKDQGLASGVHKSAPGSLNGVGRRPPLSHVALAEPPLASGVNGAEDGRVFQRRCPSILNSSVEYDDDLVAMCRGWAARK
jgi:hypothetical protein